MFWSSAATIRSWRVRRQSGARFSAAGSSGLVKRAQDHADLAMCVWSRPDIPRHDLLKLFGRRRRC